MYELNFQFLIEMLHGDYFERTIGGNIRAEIFQWAKEADPNATLFVNDYEVVSGGLTNCYKKQIQVIIKIIICDIKFIR